MASKVLKGLTIKIGADTSDLYESLEKVDKQSRKLSSELGQINKLLKLDPKNTELLAQKQEVLTEAIGNTEKKLETLREAEKQVQRQFERGEVSEAQYRALQREIIETESKLDRYKDAVKETTETQRKLADGVDDTTKELDDQADKSREAEKELEDLDDSANSLAVGGLAAVAAAAAAVVTGIVAMAEESREYRTEMGKLNAAFQDNGHSAEIATKTYEALQGVVGETEQAVEAANHLAALCDTEEELAEWTEILTGVYGKWGASLSIESLTEAANETARVGTVTGAFADSLNWAAAEGETFGVVMREATEESEEWNKVIAETERKLQELELAEKQNTEQLDAAKDKVSALKWQISDTKAQLTEYKDAVKKNSGSTWKWKQAITETEEKLKALQEAERQAKKEQEALQKTTEDTASRLKDEIAATKEALENARKAAEEAAGPTTEWNKAVEEAASAEDYFNLALQECSTEQERQQLITKTLTKLYGNAATQYKKTNKEVIRANEATEKWNKTVADIGAEVEPVVTDIKELGTTILEEAAEPLEDVAHFIRKKVLPAIKDAGGWVKKNLPQIEAVLIGVVSAMVAYEAATLATTVAQKGFKGALLASEVAQKALNLAQTASPIGLFTAGVVGLTVAVEALTWAMGEANRPADVLTEAERELMSAADEAAEAFRDQRAATEEALQGITAQMGYVDDLADELQGLADASGRVQESDQARAQFILNELNEALGTEYTMVDGVIVKYDELKSSIDAVLQSKLANSLLEAANADYVSAIQNEADALKNLTLKEEDYQQQLAITTEKKDRYNQAYAAWLDAMKTGNASAMQSASDALLRAQIAYEEEDALLQEKKAAYDQAAADYGTYYNTIANYEDAQAAALSGNYQQAVDLLSRKGAAYGTYSDKVDQETAKVLDALYKEAVDAGLEAERTKKNFENGVDGYTEEMVTEAEKGYQDALDEFATAYADAEGVGEDLGDGLSGGMENKRGGLLAKAKSLVSGIISAMREEADSNSPAKKTIAFGEDVGAGAEIGIENKTDDVKRAATHQAAAILDAYSEQEVAGQRTLRRVAEQQAANYNPSHIQVTSTNGPLLEKILEAIERGQVLTLDGDALVGATANKMDTALGRRRVLASRGAI